MRLDGEMLGGATDLVIYTGSIRAWEGSGELLDDAERKRVIGDLEAICRKNGLTVLFQP